MEPMEKAKHSLDEMEVCNSCGRVAYSKLRLPASAVFAEPVKKVILIICNKCKRGGVR